MRERAVRRGEPTWPTCVCQSRHIDPPRSAGWATCWREERLCDVVGGDVESRWSIACRQELGAFPKKGNQSMSAEARRIGSDVCLTESRAQGRSWSMKQEAGQEASKSNSIASLDLLQMQDDAWKNAGRKSASVGSQICGQTARPTPAAPGRAHLENAASSRWPSNGPIKTPAVHTAAKRVLASASLCA